MDILCIISVIEALFTFQSILWIVDFFILWKIQAIYSILNKYYEILVLKRSAFYPAIIRLVRLFSGVLFVAHFLACAFLGIAVWEKHMGE